MYRKIALSGDAEATPYELARLRRAEFTARMNNLILESFDIVTDLAFMLVLFDQGLALNLPETWYIIGVSSCGGTVPVSPGERGTILQLAYAAAFFFALNCIFRLVTAAWQISTNAHRVEGFTAWFLCLLGVPFTVIDPWNGAVLIDNQFSNKGDVQAVDDYVSTLREIRADWANLVMEDAPQFVIQVIYGVLAAQSAGIGLTPAWFVSTLTTVIHMLSQIHELLFLHVQLPNLKQFAAKAQARVEDLVMKDDSA